MNYPSPNVIVMCLSRLNRFANEEGNLCCIAADFANYLRQIASAAAGNNGVLTTSVVCYHDSSTHFRRRYPLTTCLWGGNQNIYIAFRWLKLLVFDAVVVNQVNVYIKMPLIASSTCCVHSCQVHADSRIDVYTSSWHQANVPPFHRAQKCVTLILLRYS